MTRKFAPISDRMKVYNLVRRFVDTRGFKGVSELARELKACGYVLPSRETLRRWALGKTSPFSGKRLFDRRPSEELSFFLGAWLGDGWGDENDGGKRMLLKVRSRDFAEEFARSAAKILRKSDSYWVRRIRDETGEWWYFVKVTSFMLYDFVNRPLRSLRRYIELSPSGFLRGFYTAEGSPSVSISRRRGSLLNVGLDLSNSNYYLLELTRGLLVGFGYRPGRIRLVQPVGSVTNLGQAKKPCWLLTMSKLIDA